MHGHGNNGDKAYRIWADMNARCRNHKNKAFSHYGGRGIEVCESWRNFANFYADMGDRPSPKHRLDRIDNDGPYKKENCRWATQREQVMNRRVTRLATINGETKPVIDWCGEFGLKYWTVMDRINRHGLDPATALTTPLSRRSPRK